VARRPDDNLPLSNLSGFLLAMIDQGLETPYELLRDAGISPGAAIPALQRMEKAGLLKKSAAGSRRRRSYSLTTTCRSELKEFLSRSFSAPCPKDLDAALRTIALAATTKGKKNAAERLLLELREHRSALEKEMRAVSTELPNHASELYSWLGKSFEAARLKGEREALAKILTLLGR